MGEKNLSPSHSLTEALRDVKRWFQEDLSREALRRVKEVLERGMEAELTEKLLCRSYQRSPQRQGYRHGYYERGLVTSLGEISRLRVPRRRGQPFQSKLLERYRRRQWSFDLAVLKCFLLGVSTRKCKEITEAFNQVGISAQTVSNILRKIDRDVVAYHRRSLRDEYVVLVCDGMWVRVKELGVKKRPVLLVLGIKADGKQEVVDFRLGWSEGVDDWQGLLTDLYLRGLKGEKLGLAVHDGEAGLKAALSTVYPQAEQQPCVRHLMMNVLEKIKERKHRKPLLRDVHRIYQAATHREAQRRFSRVLLRWKDKEPSAMAILRRKFGHTLTYLNYPESWHSVIRTTNHLERLIREIRRRTRPMGAFANGRSCERIVYSILSLYQLPDVKPMTTQNLFTQDS